MAKKEYDSFVVALISLKDMISTLKTHGTVIGFDDTSNIIYVTGGNSAYDKFAKITDETIFTSSRKFLFHLLSTVDVVSFNKALKKTKTISEICDDNSIKFSTDGYEVQLSLPELPKMNMITSKYNMLFKNLEVTKNIMRIESDDFIRISDEDLEALQSNKLVGINSSTGNLMYITKAIFGNIKKTQSISHAVISSNQFDEIVLFKQEEAGFEVYTVIRFLRA